VNRSPQAQTVSLPFCSYHADGGRYAPCPCRSLRISANQKLSENFIREFQNKIDWWCILKYQKLSEDFKKEFKYKLNDYYPNIKIYG
jgi:hypothetical protein